MKKIICMLGIIVLLSNGIAYAGFLAEYGKSKPSEPIYCSPNASGGITCR